MCLHLADASSKLMPAVLSETVAVRAGAVLSFSHTHPCNGPLHARRHDVLQGQRQRPVVEVLDLDGAARERRDQGHLGSRQGHSTGAHFERGWGCFTGGAGRSAAACHLRHPPPAPTTRRRTPSLACSHPLPPPLQHATRTASIQAPSAAAHRDGRVQVVPAPCEARVRLLLDDEN